MEESENSGEEIKKIRWISFFLDIIGKKKMWMWRIEIEREQDIKCEMEIKVWVVLVSSGRVEFLY